MSKNSFRLIWGVVGLLLSLSGCRSEQMTAMPDSPIPGFFSAGQEVTGGQTVEGLNLYDITAAINDGETLLSLSFAIGSSKEGGTEKPLNQVPAYTIESLTGPGRLMVTLPLAYKDYQAPQPAGLFTGMYILSEIESGMTRLYFQFTGKIGFKVDEQKDTLLLRIEPEDPDEFGNYYATVEYDSSTLSAALMNGMHPVCCDDDENMLLISGPFGDNTQADALVAALNEIYDAAKIDHRAGVRMMEGNAAPVYHANISRTKLNQLGALSTVAGELLAAEPWAIDARFLAWTPGGEGLCAHPVVREEDAIYEQLWIYSVEGDRQRFIDSEFASVDRAAFSPDGHYLAFIEKVETKRLLYIYDILGQKLDFLSSEGMGDFTASFDWSADGRLYALSGTESLQLMCFNPQALDGQSRVSAVEERYSGAGSVYCASGWVYINGDIAGQILQINPRTGERAEYVTGDGFAISPDDKAMLISYYEPEKEIDSQTGVKVLDMATGAEQVLTSGLTYHGCCWSQDGALLSFLVSNQEQMDVEGGEEDVVDLKESAGSDEYPAQLYIYNVQTGECKMVGKLASDSVYPGRDGREVVLVAYHMDEDQRRMPVTYRLELP